MISMHSIRQRQQGLTLVEILVAITILAVVMTIALTIYSISQKSYKKGENKAEQQQAVRIAFDKLNADLRMTGFNYNPDGDKSRPDEQIEAAYDTAVVIRGDFDAEDAAAAATPETALATGGAFLSVSTGNDEIVAYALAKPDGSSTDTLTFEADVKDSPRDGNVEVVNIPNVALVQDDPPYTLYRITLNDHTNWGGSGFLTRTPLIENVYAMNFRYYTLTGLQANATFDLGTTADDIGGADTNAAKAQRRQISRFGIELVGLTRDPDLDYVDPDDDDPDTRKFRKFTLTGDITPRNIGMVGVKDIASDVTPPGKPATPNLTPGHCGGLYISWTENPVSDQVAYYRISYGTTAGAPTGSRSSSSNSYYLGGLADATTYYVSIQAIDDAGNLSVPSNESNAVTADVNVPNSPTALAASNDLNGAVNVQWSPVTENTNADPAADPGSRIRDLAGYRLYRSEGGDFNSVHTKLIADENAITSKRTSILDSEVVNCRSYNYWLTAVDTCGHESDESNRATGNSTSNVLPARPEGIQAHFAGENQVEISWNKVQNDVDGKKIFIDNYNLYRAGPVPRLGDITGEPSFQLLTTVTSEAEVVRYRDPVVIPDGHTVYYRASALDDCGNESALSDAAEPLCAFSADVVFLNPANNEPVAGVVPVRVAAVNGLPEETYVGVVLHFQHETENYQHEVTLESESPDQKVWNYNWLASPPGPYTITATVYNGQKCAKTETIHVAAGFDVGCCLSQPDPELVPIILDCIGVANKLECATLRYEVINNNCLTAVAIDGIAIDWTDVTGTEPLLTDVLFDSQPLWSPGGVPPIASLSILPEESPTIGVERSSADPVPVVYVYDKSMYLRHGNDVFRNTLTTSFDFTLLDDTGSRTMISGTCGPETGWFDQMITGTP